MKIFLSYASQDKETGESIAYSLRNSHKVFFDCDALQAGASYDRKIEDAVKDSDILIFLISPDSVAERRYTLTELRFAREKWPHPSGRVLPVMVRKTPLEQVPSYLKAVTILEPAGNIAAETSAAVNKMHAGLKEKLIAGGKPVMISAILLLLTTTVVISWHAIELLYSSSQKNGNGATINNDDHQNINVGASINQSGGQTAGTIINAAPPRREISDQQRKDFKNAVENPDDPSIYSSLFPTRISNHDPIYIYVNSDSEEARRFGSKILQLLRESGLKAMVDQAVPNRYAYFEGLRLEGTTYGYAAQVVERAFKKADIKCDTQLRETSKVRNEIIIGASYL